MSNNTSQSATQEQENTSLNVTNYEEMEWLDRMIAENVKANEASIEQMLQHFSYPATSQFQESKQEKTEN